MSNAYYKALKIFYKKYQYFLNLLIVLIILTAVRMFDWMVWLPSTPGIQKYIISTQLFEFISGLPLIIILIYSYKWALKNKNVILILSLFLIFCLFGMVALKYIGYFLKLILWKKGAIVPTKNILILYTPNGILVFTILSATFYLTYFWLKYLKHKDEIYNSEILAKNAQLKMLCYQINPHFLFNTLNSIHALIDENKDKGKQLIVNISEYYRYTLDNQQYTSTIEMEVLAISKYLEIQKARFEERINYNLYIDEALYSFQIPAFIILLLIENAVKYGLKSKEPILEIRFSAKKINTNVVISVINTGKLIPNDKSKSNNADGTGTGIENIKSRLSLFYNNNYSFSLIEANGCVEANITIFNISHESN